MSAADTLILGPPGSLNPGCLTASGHMSRLKGRQRVAETEIMVRAEPQILSPLQGWTLWLSPTRG